MLHISIRLQPCESWYSPGGARLCGEKCGARGGCQVAVLYRPFPNFPTHHHYIITIISEQIIADHNISCHIINIMYTSYYIILCPTRSKHSIIVSSLFFHFQSYVSDNSQPVTLRRQGPPASHFSCDVMPGNYMAIITDHIITCASCRNKCSLSSSGSVSKPWYLVNPKIAGKWMFIP